MAASKQHHYFSVWIDFSDGDAEFSYFGFSERQAAWQFYRAIKAAERKPGATAVDLRRDGVELASVPIKALEAMTA